MVRIRQVWGRTGVRAGTAALLGLLLIGGGIAWLADPMTLLLADFRTAPAETRSISLPDGSRLDLGPATAVAFRFTERERRVRLLSGVVRVSVVSASGGAGRPFVVEAGNGSTRAFGTRFVVDRLSESVRVTALDRRVGVSVSPVSELAAAVVLSAGQSVRYDHRAGLGTVREAGQADPWRGERLVFDRVPLAEVIAELNRYRRGRILVLDSALAARLVTAVIETARLEDGLAAVVSRAGARTASLPWVVTLLY